MKRSADERRLNLLLHFSVASMVKKLRRKEHLWATGSLQQLPMLETLSAIWLRVQLGLWRRSLQERFTFILTLESLLVVEPLFTEGSEDETVIVYQSESDNHSGDDQTARSMIASPRRTLPKRRTIKVTESRLKLFFTTLPERIIASYTFDILVALFAFVFLLKIGACKIVQFKFQEF